MKRFILLTLILLTACSSSPTPASYFDSVTDSAPSTDSSLPVNQTQSSPNANQEIGDIYFFLQPRTAGKSIELVKISGTCVYDSNCPLLEKIQVPFQFNFVINALTWSPDGKYAAFSYPDSLNGTPTKLWIFDADAKTWTSIAQFPFIDPPFWSAENLIAFRAQDGLGNEDVYVINPDGSALRKISANLPKENQPYVMDGWAKESVLIRSALTQKIFFVNINGDVQEKFNKQVIASPNGEYFVYDDFDSNTNMHTLKLTTDFVNHTSLTQFPSGFYPIAWSPDNDLIAFNIYNANNQAEVYVISNTGQNLKLIYQGTTIGRLLFSPNGKYLLVEKTTSISGGHLFLINLATLEQKMLQAPGLSTDYDWYAPSWRP
jgi:Tol biopolymer transport system component